jgi:CubicO group peptidase (beta-lactamase class C family)
MPSFRSPWPSIAAGLMTVAAAGCSTDSSTPREPEPAAAQIREALTAALARTDIPGAVAIAVTADGVEFEGACCVPEGDDGRLGKTDTIFRIASMTKAITSVAAMQLVESGRLGLDDRADKYLAEFASVQVLRTFDPATGAYTLSPPRSPVTVRHLLTHTSGLGYAFTDWRVRDFKPRRGDTFKVGPLMFDPGTEWLYGTNTDWVGRLVETISSQSLEAYFREHILDPLKMRDTTFVVPPDKHERVVSNFSRGENGAMTRAAREPLPAVTAFNGGGGLYSTAADYGRFLRMLLRGGELDGARVLSSDSIALMARDHLDGLHARALKTALPNRSRDFSFIEDQRDGWGLGFQITATARPGRRAEGSLSWGGINNTYFWVDRSGGVAGAIMMQFLPFADPDALAVYDAFEGAVYADVSARRATLTSTAR